ncbi:LPS translocon maturation chaperone LptM [Dyella humicola]|uniref:LPS translocon maturation chaperone LptM n=1 Tax=Dyella humicola TaxID=2992126 RepID=UPI00224E58A0|nr:lipoprotein [Dyella humicola]
MRRSLLLLPLCTAFVLIAACGNKGPLYMPAKSTPPAAAATDHPAAAPAPAPAAQAPVHGYVTDMKAFDAFIATHPTPAQFLATYPDVQLVMPGEITTMEFRTNNSRYFPEQDATGHIVGGSFR